MAFNHVVVGSSPTRDRALVGLKRLFVVTPKRTGTFLYIENNRFVYYPLPDLTMFATLVTLAQLVERKTFNLVVVGSSPTCDTILYSSVGRAARLLTDGSLV